MPTEHYKATYAQPDEFQKVVDFYSDAERRTEAVYLRDPDVVREAIEKKLFLTIQNKDGAIVAGSALYPLANREPIACVVNAHKEVIEEGRIVELGSVLRMGKGPHDIHVPTGIWHLFLFGIPMVTAFKRAKNGLQFDVLMADVQEHKTNTNNYIVGAPSTRSPLRWEKFNAAPELVAAFEKTTHDPNVKNPKIYYRASATGLPNVAETLLLGAERGFPNHEGFVTNIDLSELDIISTLKAIVDKNWVFEAKMPYNISWSEAARVLTSTVPSDYLGSYTAASAEDRAPQFAIAGGGGAHQRRARYYVPSRALDGLDRR